MDAQMAIDFTGRPTYYEFLRVQSTQTEDKFELDEDSCLEVDREFVQFYHRRVCWLQLKEFDLAVRDADHTLALMDFCKRHSSDEQWTISHEQYRPFVLYHRTQAAALAYINQEENLGEDENAAAPHRYRRIRNRRSKRWFDSTAKIVR
jgi:hypothetical protein